MHDTKHQARKRPQRDYQADAVDTRMHPRCRMKEAGLVHRHPSILEEPVGHQQDGYDDETKFSGSIGGGLRVPFNERVAATFGLRGYVTFVDSDTGIFCLSDATGASCLLRTSGSTIFQGEALLGLTVRF